MAEYYPLLAKAIGSLPNSTPESRRVVYERARKALIGQLRTLHPPVPDADIEHESVELDRAVERVEAEIANGGIPAPAPVAPTQAAKPLPPATEPSPPDTAGGAIGPAEKRTPPPLRAKPLAPRTPITRPSLTKPAVSPPADEADTPPMVPLAPPKDNAETAGAETPAKGQIDHDPAVQAVEYPGPAARDPVVVVPIQPTPAEDSKRLKPPQRPIAPQPPGVTGPKRKLWIIPVGIGAVVAIVALAAWKLRDRPEIIARNKPTEQTQADSGKTAERVGGPATTPVEGGKTDEPAQQPTPTGPATDTRAAPQQAPSAVAPTNPELPVAHRAALLVEAPDEPNKVKTFLGNVVWKLNNVSQGQNDAVGLAVEADIDLPDDKLKAVVTFEKNTDASLPASHTIKVRFAVDPGSFSGNVKQISVLQMRPESSPSGDALAGVTVQVVPNSFLIGLSPGNAEGTNTDLIRRQQWIDIPILLDSGKIAKLTFEKGDSGQRDLNEAFDSWQKQ